MISKQKGNIGEAVILTEFVKRGILVSQPFGDCARYDLIADFDGKLNRIQIKYCNKLTPTGAIECPTSSKLNHTTNKKLTTYKDDVDYIACYIVPLDKSILIPIEDIGDKKSICIRQSPTKNNQINGVHFIWEYEFDKILNINQEIEITL